MSIIRLKDRKAVEDDIIDLLDAYNHAKAPKILFSIFTSETASFFDIDYTYIHEEGTFEMLFRGFAYALKEFIDKGFLSIEDIDRIKEIVEELKRKEESN